MHCHVEFQPSSLHELHEFYVIQYRKTNVKVDRVDSISREPEICEIRVCGIVDTNHPIDQILLACAGIITKTV